MGKTVVSVLDMPDSKIPCIAWDAQPCSLHGCLHTGPAALSPWVINLMAGLGQGKQGRGWDFRPQARG